MVTYDRNVYLVGVLLYESIGLGDMGLLGSRWNGGI